MWKALWYQIKSTTHSLLGDKIPAILGWHIFTIDKNPITLGQLIAGCILIILGYFSLRKLTYHLEKYILKQLDVQESIGHAISTLVFYVLLIILLLFTLRLLNIPITIFTLILGAFAVGIGLGSQNIVNNFISGLIILLEQPIRPGDIVEIEGLTGKVERVRARATRVKSIDNTQIVVPNSSFLEKNIINWTLSDSIVRRIVNVGVIYGSPTLTVKKLLLQAAEEHKKTLKSPKPLVLFDEFGNHSLNFSLSFWFKANTVIELRQIPSDIRYRIDELFRQNKIVIAFPQQDTHFRTPLYVKLSQSSSQESSTPKNYYHDSASSSVASSSKTNQKK